MAKLRFLSAKQPKNAVDRVKSERGIGKLVVSTSDRVGKVSVFACGGV